LRSHATALSLCAPALDGDRLHPGGGVSGHAVAASTTDGLTRAHVHGTTALHSFCPAAQRGATRDDDPCVPRAATAEAAEHANMHAHATVFDDDAGAAGNNASSEWQTTLASVSKAVVVLKVRTATTALMCGTGATRLKAAHARRTRSSRAQRP
jgi:hypothetical protein